MRTISAIALDIKNDWGSKVSFSARPYLSSMLRLQSVDDMDFRDRASDVVRYFLANASTYRGERARALKNELKQLLNK